MTVLDREYFKQDAVTVAKEIVGKLLCVNVNGKTVKMRITETEAYLGSDDTACHAHKGRTARTEVMFCQGGVTYIYLCYGIHYMLNIVTGEKDSPQAVLIRGLEGVYGPGRLTKQLGITKTLNNKELCTANGIWVEQSSESVKIKKGKRIGIAYADEKDRNRLWRFTIDSNQ